ncbi:4563_t:CDS:2, partial [Funneliformis geosporum]
MGNPYRNMAKRNLTWRFFHEVEENSEAFPIDIDESEFVSELGKKIKEKVKELKNDICSDIDDDDLDLQLWKVNISNSDVDKFSSLRLQKDESKGIEKLEGINLISKYWGDLEEGFTHVIVTSNYLINQNLREKIKELTENFGNVSVQSEKEMGYFGRLSEMLTTLKKNKNRAENSILQLAYSEKIVSEGDDILYNNIKITTLKVAEGWAYIEYENEYFTSISEFIKKKEMITYPPVPKQRDLFAIGNRSYQNIREILGPKLPQRG